MATPLLTRDTAIQAAADETRAWQSNPTTQAFETMLAAIDTATGLGATNDDIIEAFATTPTTPVVEPALVVEPEPKPDTVVPAAYDHFLVSVNALWSAWTGGHLNDTRAFAGIREALTELEDDKPTGPTAFHTFHTTVAAATTDWEQGQADEEDAMVRILDALHQLDTDQATAL